MLTYAILIGSAGMTTMGLLGGMALYLRRMPQAGVRTPDR